MPPANATLLVARLDRLGRDVETIVRLVKSDVDIVASENPYATRFTIHILAAAVHLRNQGLGPFADRPAKL